MDGYLIRLFRFSLIFYYCLAKSGYPSSWISCYAGSDIFDFLHSSVNSLVKRCDSCSHYQLDIWQSIFACWSWNNDHFICLWSTVTVVM